MKQNKTISFTAVAVMAALLSLAVSSFAQQTAAPSETMNTTVAKASSEKVNTPSIDKAAKSTTTKTDTQTAAASTDDNWDYHSDNDWHLEFRPYLWAAGLNGNLRVNNTTRPVQQDFSNIIGHLDFALAGQFEAGKGRWRAIVDENYINLGTEFRGPNGNVDIDIQPTMNIFEGGAAFAMVRHPHKEDGDSRPPAFSAELLGGVRWLHLTTGFNPAGAASFEGSTDQIGFFVGNRYKFNVSRLVTLVGRWTVGTSGAGSGVNGTADAYADIHVARHFSLTGGYRYMNLNANDLDESTGFQGQMKGFLAGFVIRH